MNKQLIDHYQNLKKIFLIAPLRYAREVKRIRARSAKEQECKVLPKNSPNSANNTTTNNVADAAAHRPIEVVARRGTAVLRIVDRRTAPQRNFTAWTCPGTAIYRRIYIVFMPPILAPLPHIPTHII
jgi:hypothetical protein